MRGFTLLELLVALSVITLLIGLMVPAISRVRSTTHRVICSSNIRQIGLGVAMFADDHDGELPGSYFVDAPNGESDVPIETVRLRIGSSSAFISRTNASGSSSLATETRGVWDGLGHLYNQEYLEARGVYYCPSHTGQHRLADSRESWEDLAGNLFGNFQYRAEGPDGTNQLWRIEPRASVLVSDSLRPDDQLNHEDGANTLRADLAVLWYSDPEQELIALSRTGDTRGAWRLLDGRAQQGQNPSGN